MSGLSIRSLLIGLFAVMALVVGGEGILSINKIGLVNSSVVDMADNWLPASSAARDMNTLAERRRSYLARHVLYTTDAEMKTEEATIARTSDAFAAARKRYEALIDTPEERKVYDEFSKAWEAYQPVVNEVLKLSRANQKAEAGKLFTGELSRTFTGIRALLMRLVEVNENGAKEAVRHAAETYASARAMTTVTLSVGLLIGIGAMVFSFFGIARPIGRITESMGVLAGGDTNAEIPFAARRDEIGRMAAAVQVFKDNMIKARELEAQAAETAARNAAQRKADMH
jgi:methyl-accepting chemotaxis protein